MTLLAYLERGWRVRFSSQGWCKRVGQRMGKSRLDGLSPDAVSLGGRCYCNVGHTGVRYFARLGYYY